MYKIYKIVSKRDVNTVYIGSTKQYLSSRLYAHKINSRYLSENNKKEEWITENYNEIDIIQINSASSKKEALFIEEAEILKHKEQGYTILNELLPTNNKLILKASVELFPITQLTRRQKQVQPTEKLHKRLLLPCTIVGYSLREPMRPNASRSD